MVPRSPSTALAQPGLPSPALTAIRPRKLCRDGGSRAAEVTRRKIVDALNPLPYIGGYGPHRETDAAFPIRFGLAGDGQQLDN